MRDTLFLEDLTFAGANTKYLTHGLHPYPARMIPQIARRFISEFSNRGDVILDPFCGSGSVLVESRLLGRNSIGVDLNPLAIILAKAKTTPIEPGVLKQTAENLLRKIETEKGTFYEPPDIPNLTYWFKEKVIKDLTLIRHNLFKVEDETVKTYLKAVFSKTVREVSNIKSGEHKLVRIPEDKLENYNPNVFEIFTRNVRDATRRMEAFYFACNKEVFSEVLLGDIRQIHSIYPDLENKADLVVTSPPYGDSHTTVAYGQFSRYSALWLGLEKEQIEQIMKLDRLSLGGKPLKEKPNLPSETFHAIFNQIAERNLTRAFEFAAYFADIYECLRAIYKLLKKNHSHCVFVIANRTVSRVKVPNDLILIELAKELGFNHLVTKYRRIPSKRMPWKNAPENIPGEKGETMVEESIIVWQC